MYGNTPFDGNAAFSGGGFMPSQATQTADPSSSPAKNRDAQVLLPLTVKQINDAFEASDDKSSFLIDGVDVNNVRMVGMLFEKAERVSDVTFVLDDGTGRIVCHRWAGEAADAKEVEMLENGMYVKVHGHLKGFFGRKQLVVFSIRPITDYDEIASHFVECIYVHCYNTRHQKLPGAAQFPGQVPSSAVNTPLKNYQPASANQVSVQHTMDAVQRIEKMILDYLQQPSCIARVSGAHRNELIQKLNVSESELMAAIEVLENEGLVYTSIDEFHYKSIINA